MEKEDVPVDEEDTTWEDIQQVFLAVGSVCLVIETLIIAMAVRDLAVKLQGIRKKRKHKSVPQAVLSIVILLIFYL